MEIIRRKILLNGIYGGNNVVTSENQPSDSPQSLVRGLPPSGPDCWPPPCGTDEDGNGTIVNSDKIFFSIPIFLTQNFEDVGLFSVMPYIQKSPLLTIPPSDFIGIGRPKGITISMYYGDEVKVTGTTDDGNIVEVQSYIVNPINGNPNFRSGVNMAKDIQFTFDGVDSISSNKIEYTIGANPNDVINTGIHYTTYLDEYVDKIDTKTGEIDRYNKTEFNYKTKGRTEFNTSLSAITKEEEFLGIVFPQEVRNEVFIERGEEDIFEKHMIMAEIKTVDDIEEYRNGYLINKNT